MEESAQKELKAIPLSLRKKSSARLAAVQCVYRLKINKDFVSAENLYEEYMSQWHEDKESVNRAMSFEAEPDKKMFLNILQNATDNADRIDEIIRASLGDKWALERMSKLLIAIIECGICELKFCGSNLRPAIIIDQYVGITARFFEANDVGFVNGFLDALGKSTDNN